MPRRFSHRALVVTAVAVAASVLLSVGAVAAGVLLASYGTANGKTLIAVRAVGDGWNGHHYTSTVPTEHTDLEWRDYDFQPGEPNSPVTGVTFDIPRRTSALVILRLNARVGCTTDGAVHPDGDTCNLRLLVDGQPLTAYEFWETATPPPVVLTRGSQVEFLTNLPSGRHTVTVQRAIFNGDGAQLDMYLDSVRLVVEVYRQN